MLLKTVTTAALGGAALLFAGAAMAQDAAPANPAAGEERGAWVKVCNKGEQTDNKELCLTSQELRTDDGRFVASAAIRELEGNEKKTFIMALPPGMLLQPGVRVQVDENAHIEGKYAICFPNACYAELPIDANFIAGLKRGNKLTVTALNQQGKGVAFPLTLAGFTKTYDGPPIDAKQLEAQQQKLQSELQKRAEEARQKLLQQQGSAPAAAPK